MPARVTVGNAPAVAAVDPATRTVYVENAFDFTVSVVNGATCNGQNTSGCGQTPPTLDVGAEPNSNLVVDQSTRTLFVVNTQSDTISAVDTRDCHAGNASGCSRRSPTIQTGNQPFWIELDPSTGTLYVPHHIDEDVTAFDARVCNARRRAGCRREAPTVAIPDGVFSVEVDPSTHTLWTGGGDNGALSLVDTRRCRAGKLSGCEQTPFEAPMATELRQIVLDHATHTLYIIDPPSSRLLVLDASTCNVRRHTDCTPLATITTGDVPLALGLNPRTHAVYTANIVGGSVSVIDGAHCNAVDASGCAAPPETVPLEGGPFGVAVDPSTNTAYISLIDASEVVVLHGSEPVGTIPGIPGPVGLDVDRRTRTLYVSELRVHRRPGRPERGRHPCLQRARRQRLRRAVADHLHRPRTLGGRRRSLDAPRVHGRLRPRHRLGHRGRVLQRLHPARLRTRGAADPGRQHPPRPCARPRAPHALRGERTRSERVGHQLPGAGLVIARR